jgi:CubicO group peptidase (beta-lactamase class C family)
LIGRRPLKHRCAGLVLLLVLARPAIAAGPGDHAMALAAGYKAAFVCSGVFDAGQSEAAIDHDDLTGVYPEYQTAVNALFATVDRAAKTVSVTYDPRLPPRIVAWRPNLGCTQLPIGAATSAAALLPRLDLKAPAARSDAPWPAGEAPGAAPSPALAAVLAGAFAPAAYGAGERTTAVLVVEDGRIVGETYRSGYDAQTPQRTWSVAKSLTGSLVGRAVRLGLVRLDDPPDIPEWRAPGDPRAAIGWRDLMSMSSGLFTNGPGNRTDEVYIGGGAVDQVVIAIPLEATPGTRFRYANDDALLAARALRATLGDGRRALTFPFTELLWKIGMDHTTLETDWRGNFILSSQVWTTSRDLARLGQLYLNDGVWNGERLLPEGWSRFVATPAKVQPEGAKAAGKPGYGAFFWLFGPAQGLPDGSYAMLGNRGQFVFIVPSRHVVIVRRGFDLMTGKQFDGAAFARDVLAAL